MTLEEKVHLVIGSGMVGLSGDSAVIGATKKMVPGAAGTTYPISRLGIPAIVLADGPAGLRIDPKREGDSTTYYCTHFPIATLLASTWNQKLVEEVGNSIGNEVLEYGADVLLAPALNIHRHPLCGRNFEYYSEDPLVSGKIAAAYVRGIQSNGIGTSIKHFAANNQETNRTENDTRITPRALREIYLKGFEVVVKEAEPWTVMSSYNYINGVYASENKELLTTILRDEWGFKGIVMTDWFGGKDAVAQMIAGNDMLQPGRSSQYDMIIEGVRSGKLDESILDRNVKRILELILQSPHFRGYRYSNKPDLKSHATVTRQSATEGMILLKNENKTLPLTDGVKNIALFGCTSYDFIAGGTGSGNVNRAYTVSLLDGLKDVGYYVDESLKAIYDKHIAVENEHNALDESNPHAQFLSIPRPRELVLPIEVLRNQAVKSDVALVTLGRTSGEFQDRMTGDFELSKEESELLQSVCKAFHAVGKKVIVILNIGGVIETASWKNMPDAILLAWQAGQEGGNSVADVLSGKSSPSGKLTMTFPNRLIDVPSSVNFPMDVQAKHQKDDKKSDVKNVDYTDYEEDIYIGYRYFDTFNKEVSYPFGYGLSYASFEYADAAINVESNTYTVMLKIKNIGDMPGKEVVQLYISAPGNSSLNKPEKELKAFAKTQELAPGEIDTVTLTVNASDLASYDEDACAWVVDAGTYQFMVGSSSRDIKCTLKAEVVSYLQKTNNILKLKEPIKVLKE